MDYKDLSDREIDVMVAQSVFGVKLLPRSAFEPDRATYFCDAFVRDEETGEMYADDPTINWTHNVGDVADPYFYSAFPDTPNGSKAIMVPNYSTNLTTAFTIIDKLMETAFGVTLNVNHESGWSCTVIGGDCSKPVETITAETAPRAICEAALNAHLGDEGKGNL